MDSQTPNTLTRRRLLQGMAAAGCGAFATGYYTWRFEPHWLEITRPDLPVRSLPAQLEGCTLALLSDLHIGSQVDDDYIVDSFRRTAELRPDFVVFTGDWITYRGSHQFEQLRRDLLHLPHGRLGTFGVLGNHDYGFNWGMLSVADQVVNIAQAAGVTMLSNEAAVASGLRFVGIDDFWGPRWSPAQILAQQGQDAAIALCHNPDGADSPVWGAFEGWILAGHTHGGQCKAPFLQPPLLPVTNRRYVSGAYELSGNRHMYISRGVGHLLRVRFNVRPEVTLFRLVRAVA